MHRHPCSQEKKLKVSRNTQGLKLKLKKHTGSCCFDRIDGQRYQDFAAFADILSIHKKKIHRAVHYYRLERVDDRDRSTVLTGRGLLRTNTMSVASNDTAHLCYSHLVSLYDGEEASLSWGTEQLSDLTHFTNLLHLWSGLAKTKWELRVNRHRYLGNLKSLPFFRPDADKTCSQGSIGERKKGNWRHETDLFWLEVQILNFHLLQRKKILWQGVSAQIAQACTMHLCKDGYMFIMRNGRSIRIFMRIDGLTLNLKIWIRFKFKQPYLA